MDEPELKIIDVFICKLRKKIADLTGGNSIIETVWGRGYIIRDNDETATVQSMSDLKKNNNVAFGNSNVSESLKAG